MVRRVRWCAAAVTVAGVALAGCGSLNVRGLVQSRGAASPRAAAEQFYRAVLNDEVPPVCPQNHGQFAVQTGQEAGRRPIVRATDVVGAAPNWVVTVEFAADGSISTTVPVVEAHGRYFACP